MASKRRMISCLWYGGIPLNPTMPSRVKLMKEADARARETVTVTPILLCPTASAPPTSHPPLDLAPSSPYHTLTSHPLGSATLAIGLLPGPMVSFERTVCSFNWSWV